MEWKGIKIISPNLLENRISCNLEKWFWMQREKCLAEPFGSECGLHPPSGPALSKSGLAAVWSSDSIFGNEHSDCSWKGPTSHIRATSHLDPRLIFNISNPNLLKNTPLRMYWVHVALFPPLLTRPLFLSPCPPLGHPLILPAAGKVSFQLSIKSSKASQNVIVIYFLPLNSSG